MTAPARTTAPRTAPRRAPRPAATPQTASPRARRPDLRVVAPPRRRVRRVAVLSIAVVLVFGSLLASALFHSVLVTGQAHLDRVDKSIDTEKADLQRARLALADAQSPARIAAQAERLGMVPADRQVWISPGTKGQVLVTGTGTPPDSSTQTGATEQTTADGRTTTDKAPDGAAQ